MKIEFYLINLDDNYERLASADLQLKAQAINYIRVSAFDGRNLNPNEHPLYNKMKSLSYMGRELVGGEIGCFISHMKCAKLFLESSADFAVVLEDDFKSNADLKETINKTLSWLMENNPTEWALINIGNNKLKLSSPLKDFHSASQMHSLRSAHYFPMTTTGLIWSRLGAEEFFKCSTQIFAPIDNFFRFWLTRSNKGLAFTPPLVQTTGVESEIDKSALAFKKRKSQSRSPF